MKQTFTITNDRVRFNCIEHIKNLMLHKPMRVTVEEAKPSRSLAQNNLLWLWMGELSKGYSEHYGEKYSPETWKIHCQQKFLGKEVMRLPCGGITEIDRGTSKLKVNEFTEFLEAIDMYAAADLKITLSHPIDLIAEAYGRKEVA